MDTTICPICKHKGLSDSDNKEWKFIGKTLLSVCNIFGIIKGIINVIRTIYYDCTKIGVNDDYLWCPNCQNYFIECPNCKKLVSIGTSEPSSPTKYKCPHCDNKFIYATHPDPEMDHSL